MKYLIDTYIFLWLLFSPSKIPNKVLALLASSDCELYICSISFWEIALKFNLGKLDLSGVLPDELPSYARKMNITIVNMKAEELASFYLLPKPQQHKDPFDRAIIWMCLQHDYTLVSKDQQMDSYQQAGLKLLPFNVTANED